MDHSTGATVDEILTAARPLKTSNVKVIPVAIGNVAEPDKMINSSPDRGNLIKATRNEKPAVLGKQIMDKVLKGNVITSYIFIGILNITLIIDTFVDNLEVNIFPFHSSDDVGVLRKLKISIKNSSIWP